MQESSAVPETKSRDGSPGTRWNPPKSTLTTFSTPSPFDSNESYNMTNNQFQVKKSFNDAELSRMWSPQDDKIFCGSTDSDNSGSYRDGRQPGMGNSLGPSATQSPQSLSGMPTRHSESPTNIDRKWTSQSHEISRFFTDGSGYTDVPGPYFGLEVSDKRPPDSSPNAIAVVHGSPLDLSYPVKDSRSDSYEATAPMNVGLGIAQGQRRGSHGDHQLAALLPMASQGRIFPTEGSLAPSSTSAKGLFEVLQNDRQRANSQTETNDHQGFPLAPFPPLSSGSTPTSAFRGSADIQDQRYRREANYANLHMDNSSWLPERNEYLEGTIPSEDTSPFQAMNKSQGHHSQGHSVPQPQEFVGRQLPAGLHLNPADMFSMDTMQQSLRSVSSTTPLSQQQPQQQHFQQQQLPPRSPQMQAQLLHQGVTSYFSPTRSQSTSSPITTNAFSHSSGSGDFYQNGSHGLNHGHSSNSFSPMAGSPYTGNSRGASPVGSDYSYGGGSGSHAHTISSADRHSQRISQMHQQQLQDPHTQFSSIEQQGQQTYDGCIYQVQFKRSHRCLILSSSAPLGIKPGDFVIVEADRGEDLGVVVSMAPRDSPLAATIFAACSSSMRGPDSEFLKKILRVASMQERMDLPAKAQEENDLLEVCRERAREMYSLPMSLVDAEYQFDRHKLILYYSASRRIDFREFVRDLFAIYKTRIWMEQATAHHSFRPSETAARALATGVLHQHHSPLTLPPSASGSNCASPSAASHNLSGGGRAHGAFWSEPQHQHQQQQQQQQQRERGYYQNGGGGHNHMLPDDGIFDMKHNSSAQLLAASHLISANSMNHSQQDFQNNYQNQSAHNNITSLHGQQFSCNQYLQRDDQQLPRGGQRERHQLEL